ncbi:MAG: hypothetical protein KDD45_13795, partial [Bdellovibrionales bacterium]|nr:hypothetical protein [Bdellovibrionales bacterium]
MSPKSKGSSSAVWVRALVSHWQEGSVGFFSAYQYSYCKLYLMIKINKVIWQLLIRKKYHKYPFGLL